MKPSTSGSAASASGPKAAITEPWRVAGTTRCSKSGASATLRIWCCGIAIIPRSSCGASATKSTTLPTPSFTPAAGTTTRFRRRPGATPGSTAGLRHVEGFWKPDAYLRQALWSSKPMVYAAAWGAGSAETDAARMAQWPGNLGRTPLVERWGWTGDPRKNIPLEIYTNCDSVELLLNGRSLGEKPIADRLLPALLWAVPNEAGTVEVVGKKAGAIAARFQLKTVGQPEKIELSPDLKTLRNAGRQVSTIEVHVVDRDGNRVPNAAQTVTFEVVGAGRLVALGNADLTDGSPATASQAKLYQGRAVAVVRSAAAAGKITVRATAPGLATRPALTAGEVILTVVPIAP